MLNTDSIERCIVGGILENENFLLELVSAEVQVKHFRNELTREFISQIFELYYSAKPINVSLLDEKLKNNRNYLKAGGKSSIYNCIREFKMDSGYKTNSIAELLTLLKTKYNLLESAVRAEKIRVLAVEDSPDALAQIQKLQSEIAALGIIENKEYFSSGGNIAKNLLKKTFRQSINPNKYSGLETYYHHFDEMSDGLQNKDLIILAGRPSSGKTAFGINIVENITKKNPKASAAIFSMEMDDSQLVVRLASSLAKLNNKKIRNGKMSDFEWIRYYAALKKIEQMDIFINKTAGISPMYMKNAISSLHKKPDVVLVDYLQLGEPDGKLENRQQDVAKISKGLKDLAKSGDFPVVAISQLSRGVESRNDKRPQMSDLKESGGIEQDADLVIFIYRPEYYEQKPEYLGIAEIICAKQRNGATGNFFLSYMKEITRFENMGYQRAR